MKRYLLKHQTGRHESLINEDNKEMSLLVKFFSRWKSWIKIFMTHNIYTVLGVVYIFLQRSWFLRKLLRHWWRSLPLLSRDFKIKGRAGKKSLLQTKSFASCGRRFFGSLNDTKYERTRGFIYSAMKLKTIITSSYFPDECSFSMLISFDSFNYGPVLVSCILVFVFVYRICYQFPFFLP